MFRETHYLIFVVEYSNGNVSSIGSECFHVFYIFLYFNHLLFCKATVSTYAVLLLQCTL